MTLGSSTVIASRAAALAILLGIGVLLFPVLSAPFDRYRNALAAQQSEQAVLQAASKRLSTIMTLARRAPVLRAPNREAAQAAMMQIVTGAVPTDDMRILSIGGDGSSDPDNSRIDVAFSAEATPAGLTRFATTLAEGENVLAVTRMAIAASAIPAREDRNSPVKLAVQMVVSGHFARAQQP